MPIERRNTFILALIHFIPIKSLIFDLWVAICLMITYSNNTYQPKGEEMILRINTLHEKKGEIINEWEESIDVNFNMIVTIEQFVAKNYHSETAYRITIANAQLQADIDYLMISQKQYDRIIFCLSQVGLKKLFYDVTK